MNVIFLINLIRPLKYTFITHLRTSNTPTSFEGSCWWTHPRAFNTYFLYMNTLGTTVVYNSALSWKRHVILAFHIQQPKIIKTTTSVSRFVNEYNLLLLYIYNDILHNHNEGKNQKNQCSLLITMPKSPSKELNYSSSRR